MVRALVALAAIGFAGWTLYQQRDGIAAVLGSSLDRPASATMSPTAPPADGNSAAGFDSAAAAATAPPAPSESHPGAVTGDVVGVVTSGVATSADRSDAVSTEAGATVSPPTVALADDTATAVTAPGSSMTAPAPATPSTKPTAAPAGAGPGQLSFTVGNLPVSESASIARLTVRRTGGSEGTVSFAWHTVDDSAVGGTDYAPMTSARETMRPGQTSVNLLIPLVGDSVREPTRLFDVVIDDFAGGAKRGTITRATIAIVDDD
jgi:hypothetical protein